MQKYKLFGLAPPIWVAQYIDYIDIQRIIKCESRRCQSQEAVHVDAQPFLLFFEKRFGFYFFYPVFHRRIISSV